MQALSRTKGRLSMDYRTQDIESHHNPYIGMKLIAEHKYVPRSKEIEPMAPVPHFRKLKQNEKDANYRSHTTNTDKKQIVNTMDLIQESRDRIRQKKMKAHSDKFVHTSTDASTCNS